MKMKKYVLLGSIFLLTVVLLDYVKLQVYTKFGYFASEANRNFTSYYLYPSEKPRDNPLRHVALVKTHKCASDLMGSILLRLAEEHSLEVLLPLQTSSNLGFSPSGKFSVQMPSLSPSGKFELMALHTLYNYNMWKYLMADDFALIGMVREPLSQFASYFNYYTVGQSIQRGFPQVSVQESFDFFLQNADKLAEGGEWADKWSSLYVFKEALTNTMFFDFGGRNAENKEKHIDGIIQNFTVIMINEYFDESLVLIKNILKWDLRDILYKSKNVAGGYYFNTSKDTERDNTREQLLRIHSRYDYMLYEKSLQKFHRQKESIADFDEQVKQFRKMNKLANSWCWKTTDVSNNNISVVKLSASSTNSNSTKKESVLMDVHLCSRLKVNFLEYITQHIHSYKQRKLLKENKQT